MIRWWIRRDSEGNNSGLMRVQLQRSLPLGRRNCSPGPKDTPACILLVDPLAYSSTLEEVCSSETSENFYGSVRCLLTDCPLKTGEVNISETSIKLCLCLLYHYWTTKTEAVNYYETSVKLYGCACFSFTRLTVGPWKRRQYDLQKCI